MKVKTIILLFILVELIIIGMALNIYNNSDKIICDDNDENCAVQLGRNIISVEDLKQNTTYVGRG